MGVPQRLLVGVGAGPRSACGVAPSAAPIVRVSLVRWSPHHHPTPPHTRTCSRQIVFATYSGEGAGQVNVVDALSGTVRYIFNGTENLSFGDSRSSVAVDKEGCMYPPVARPPCSLARAHTVHALPLYPPPPHPHCVCPPVLFVASESPLGQGLVPVLWCLDITRVEPRWEIFVGDDGDEISSSSPVLTNLPNGSPIILFGAENDVHTLARVCA